MIGISKQAHYKRVNHLKKMAKLSEELIEGARQIRKEHKRMGCRKMYDEIQPDGLGRDRSEHILLANGFRVKPKRSWIRTTYAGKQWYPNLIHGMQVSDINQLWVSDITYIPISHRTHYYLTLIQDVYSRRIVGWSLSRDLSSLSTVMPAYKMALLALSGQQSGLIFHSDKGSQYSWHELKSLHEQNGVTPSMGGKAWENAHAESINGILKNEYIDFEGLKITFQQTEKLIKKIIQKYNEGRPHGSLNKMKPVEFEAYIKTLNNSVKPIFKINY
jgi:transposase InsO family protein